MKKIVILLFLFPFFIFQIDILHAETKIFTLETSSDYGVLVDDEKWDITKGRVTVDYHTRDFSSIRGTSTSLPMEFEFFSLFIPANLKYIKNYLNIYAFNTKAIFYINHIEEQPDSFLVAGTFLDNISSGYFQVLIQMDQRKNWRAFGTMSKLRFHVINEEARNEAFKEVASMISPLVN